MLLSDLPTYSLPAYSICPLLLSTLNKAATVVPAKVQVGSIMPPLYSKPPKTSDLTKNQVFHSTSAIRDPALHCPSDHISYYLSLFHSDPTSMASLLIDRYASHPFVSEPLYSLPLFSLPRKL